MSKAKHKAGTAGYCLPASPSFETLSLSAHTQAHICARFHPELSSICSYTLYFLASVITLFWDFPTSYVPDEVAVVLAAKFI